MIPATYLSSHFWQEDRCWVTEEPTMLVFSNYSVAFAFNLMKYGFTFKLKLENLNRGRAYLHGGLEDFSILFKKSGFLDITT